MNHIKTYKTGVKSLVFLLVLLVIAVQFSYMTFASEKNARAGLEFNEQGQAVKDEVYRKESIPFQNCYFDFHVNQDGEDGTVIYSVKYEGKSDYTPEISERGILKAEYPGKYRVTATSECENKIEKEEISKEFILYAMAEEEGSFISFKEKEIFYIPGTCDNTITQKAEVNLPEDAEYIHPEITYTADCKKEWFEVSEDGEIKITDLNGLNKELEKGEIRIKISATLRKNFYYGQDQDNYIIRINNRSVPEGAYTVPETNDKGWYCEDVAVQAEKGYEVSKELIPGNNTDYFKKQITFEDEGKKKRKFFVKNTLTGEIYRETGELLKIDKNPPEKSEMKTEIENVITMDKGKKRYCFASEPVKVRFLISNDDTEKERAGIQYIRWSFRTEDNLETEHGIITELEKDENHIYRGETEIDGERKGKISFYAVDEAGNKSDEIYTEEILVIDRTPPVLKVEQRVVKADTVHNVQGDTHYYNGNIENIITISEKNFFKEDCNVYLSQNGEKKKKIKNINWSDNKNLHTGSFILDKEGEYSLSVVYNEDNSGNKTIDEKGNLYGSFNSGKIVIDKTCPEISVNLEKAQGTNKEGSSCYKGKITGEITVRENNFSQGESDFYAITEKNRRIKINPQWTDNESGIKKGRFLLKGEGVYRIKADYTDLAGNRGKAYSSGTLIIDNTRPVIRLDYSNKDIKKNVKGWKYYNAPQEVTLYIEEENFDRKRVIIKCTDSKLKETGKMKKGKWQGNGKVHKLKILFPGNEEYRLSVRCSDLAGNEAEGKVEENFTVDRKAPENLKINYEEEKHRKTAGKEELFYDDKIKVRLSAEDETGTVDYFICYITVTDEYGKDKLITKKINRNKISYSGDGVKAETWFYLPLGKSKTQFNGKISFAACDRAGNFSKVYKDGKGIIVDSIPPGASVVYSEPVNCKNNILYYNNSAEIQINIKERNFFSEDPEVTIVKDGKTYKEKIKWKKTGNNAYTGKVTLKKDGHYRIITDYTDKSGNKMKPGTERLIVVDSKINKPEIKINGENGERKSFSGKVDINVLWKDRNPDDFNLKLYHTDSHGKKEDVTDKYLKKIKEYKWGVNEVTPKS